MTAETATVATEEALKTLPGDDVRQLMWRLSDRYDLQMLVQATRSVARGLVARLVANGERKSHDWTPEKEAMLKAYDESGVTAAFMDPEFGGYIEGPKNMALALVAFELAWVDAGAATASLAGNLALAPIHERGTPEQRREYMSGCIPPAPGENRKQLRGSFALTEPLPYVGVDTGVLNGKLKVVEWKDGEEPILEVQKRGRFITNMGYANFVTAAVDTADPRIKSSCMVILREDDEGLYDRGAATMKMVHQLSSTHDPVFTLKIPASRIIGGYEIKDGVIVPNYSHGEVIEAVFRRTRVTVALMTAAKLLSAVEPVIRYQRQRFRGGEGAGPGSPRYDLGLQMKEDALHRLTEIWATGEAAASLGFGAARLLDEFDPIDRWCEQYFREQGIGSGRARMKALRKAGGDALEFIRQQNLPEEERDQAVYEKLLNDKLVQYVVGDAVTNVMAPASKLWNTGHGATMMREAVSLMGGYGITEDCPGFLMMKWIDSQLEATYEGPEAVQRRQLSATMTNEVFLAQFEQWILEMRGIAAERPGSGACTLASAMELWLWSLRHLLDAKDENGKALYHSQRQGVSFAMADALCWLLASRFQIIDVVELAKKSQEMGMSDTMHGYERFFTDLCHVQAARAAGEAARVCSELVFGYKAHPAWGGEAEQRCCGDAADAMESVAPGMASCGCGENTRMKAGPCVRFDGLNDYLRLRMKLEGCMTGARLAKDRASKAISEVMIPEALDYPAA